jgi:hypothetical protein
VAGAMAMQASLGATKVMILVGAGLAGSVLLKNNKLGDFIGDLTKVRLMSISRLRFFAVTLCF